MWQPQVAALGDFHCLVPDLPEHGRSGASKPLTIAAAAEGLAALIRARAHRGEAHLVGLSLGAQTVVHLLSAHPDLVDHVVLSGCAVRPRRVSSWFDALIRSYAPFRNSRLLVRANMRALRIPSRYRDHFQEDTRNATADVLIRMVRESFQFQLPAGLVHVQTPILVLVGEREPKVIHQSAGDLLAAFPNAGGFVVPGRGHAWNFEAPELFTEVVRAWVLGRPLPSGLSPIA
jgi:pimeloyl-ACP methyl ester carboxylesterase